VKVCSYAKTEHENLLLLQVHSVDVKFVSFLCLRRFKKYVMINLLARLNRYRT
jgi:hypothetical protein